MSDLPLKADLRSSALNVRLVPSADITAARRRARLVPLADVFTARLTEAVLTEAVNIPPITVIDLLGHLQLSFRVVSP
jgi:hypothetical protein